MDTQGSVGDFSSTTHASKYEPEAAQVLQVISHYNTKSTHRLRGNYLLEKASVQEIAELCRKLSSTISYFISLNKAIYLPSLGILFPVLTMKHKSYPLDARRVAVRKEQIRSIEFEKCDDPGPQQRKKHGEYVDFFELSERVFNGLELGFQLKITRRNFQAMLKSLISLIRQEVVMDGHSNRLAPLLTFYSLHNRQGERTSDWFAGADVFIEASYSELVSSGDALEVERVVFVSPIEPFEAFCNRPPNIHHLAPELNLARLGFGQFKQGKKPQNPLRFAIFPLREEKKDQQQFLIVSDGFRKLAAKGQVGSEVTCIIQSDLELDEVRAIGESFLSLAWALLITRPLGALEPGCGISFDKSTFHQSNLSALFVAKSLHFGIPQLCRDGEFVYVHLIGITADEEHLLGASGKAHLQAILSRKGLLKKTIPSRASVLSRTALAKETSKKLYSE